MPENNLMLSDAEYGDIQAGTLVEVVAASLSRNYLPCSVAKFR